MKELQPSSGSIAAAHAHEDGDRRQQKGKDDSRRGMALKRGR
jgi:hypothetical protein